MSFIAPDERSTIDRIFSFAVVLREAGLMPYDEDEYWERPWKWTVEYDAWVGAGSPPDSNHPAWSRFLTAVEEYFATS